MRGSIDVELMRFSDLAAWKPKIGDMIFRDGFFSRWFAVISGINGDSLSVKKAGNLRLLVQDDYEEVVLNVRKIKNAMVGSFSVISNDTANSIYYT